MRVPTLKSEPKYMQNRKGSETYVCCKRSELLCVLLPMIQGDLGGQIFQLSKISKRQLQTQDAAAQDGISTEPRSYRVWSGKIAYADHDSRAISDQAVVLPQGGSSNLGMSEVWLDALTKVVPQPNVSAVCAAEPLDLYCLPTLRCALTFCILCLFALLSSPLPISRVKNNL
jgi:hypothetical protein